MSRMGTGERRTRSVRVSSQQSLWCNTKKQKLTFRARGSSSKRISFVRLGTILWIDCGLYNEWRNHSLISDSAIKTSQMKKHSLIPWGSRLEGAWNLTPFKIKPVYWSWTNLFASRHLIPPGLWFIPFHIQIRSWFFLTDTIEIEGLLWSHVASKGEWNQFLMEAN